MTIDQVPAQTVLFLDANILIYHFSAHPKYGSSCTRLFKRIENQEIEGVISSHVLADVAHRLMTMEAMNQLGWPITSLAARLRKHHREIPNLSVYRHALTKIPQIGIRTLPISEQTVLAAGDNSRRFELLTGDALIVTVMQHHGNRSPQKNWRS
jgi:predicted nucleic acid-binding protein